MANSKNIRLTGNHILSTPLLWLVHHLHNIADWEHETRTFQSNTCSVNVTIFTSAFFVMVRAGTAYRKIWRLVNSFFCSHNTVRCSEIPTVLSNLLYHYFFHWIVAHFNFVISQNAKWGHAGFYIDCHQMTVPENILLQKKHWFLHTYTWLYLQHNTLAMKVHKQYPLH